MKDNVGAALAAGAAFCFSVFMALIAIVYLVEQLMIFLAQAAIFVLVVGGIVAVIVERLCPGTIQRLIDHNFPPPTPPHGPGPDGQKRIDDFFALIADNPHIRRQYLEGPGKQFGEESKYCIPLTGGPPQRRDSLKPRNLRQLPVAPYDYTRVNALRRELAGYDAPTEFPQAA